MISDWLEPSVETRVNEIFDYICDNDPERLYHKFCSAIRAIKDKELSFDLENYFLLMVKQTTEYSYRKGISDMAVFKK